MRHPRALRTLARYHAEGVHTVLVCCTGGEEGDLQNPSLREPGQPFHGLTPEEERALVASMRTAELAASAEIIGFDTVEMLGYRDSGMAETEPNEHPDCFHQADIDEATGRLVALIRRDRPQVIITYGDDQKGYPHPDHLRVHDISVLAFERAGDPDWYPELGEPFAPSKLYYSVWSKARVIAMHELMIRLNGESPFEQDWLDRPSQDHRITTRIDITGFGYARTGALRAHATQVDPTAAWWGFGVDDDELNAAYPWEDWILARSLVGPIPGRRRRTRPVRRCPGASVEMTVQYRVVVAKKDERVDGPDDADIVFTVPLGRCRRRRLRSDRGLHAWRAQGRRRHRHDPRHAEVRRRGDGDRPARQRRLTRTREQFAAGRRTLITRWRCRRASRSRRSR